jgi:hypothetical protein
VTDDARPDSTKHDNKQADSPADDLVARLERLFDAPIGETPMAVTFDPEPEAP